MLAWLPRSCARCKEMNMGIIRYVQLCVAIAKVMLTHKAPCRFPRGDIRNYARPIAFELQRKDRKVESDQGG